MSDSSIRTNPSIDEPSNMMPAVERLLELPVGHLDVLGRAEDVGELQAHELDLLALDALENRAPGGPSFAMANLTRHSRSAAAARARSGSCPGQCAIEFVVADDAGQRGEVDPEACGDVLAEAPMRRSRVLEVLDARRVAALEPSAAAGKVP